MEDNLLKVETVGLQEAKTESSMVEIFPAYDDIKTPEDVMQFLKEATAIFRWRFFNIKGQDGETDKALAEAKFWRKAE